MFSGLRADVLLKKCTKGFMNRRYVMGMVTANYLEMVDEEFNKYFRDKRSSFRIISSEWDNHFCIDVYDSLYPDRFIAQLVCDRPSANGLPTSVFLMVLESWFISHNGFILNRGN